MGTTQTATIKSVTGAATALLRIYEGQQAPQGCYVALDLRDGRMWADYNGEIGNAVPAEVWHGIIRRYTIAPLQPATVNALMEELRPKAEIVLAHSEIIWDGHNHVARLENVAVDAEEEIDHILGEVDSDVHWWDARAWLNGTREDVIARIANGESLDAIEADYQGDGSSEDTPYVDGLLSYLEDLAFEVAP